MTDKLITSVAEKNFKESPYASIVTDEKELRKVCRETTEEEVKAKKIVECMKLAMTTAWVNGFGLAAIQIGLPIRMAWFKRAEYLNRKLMLGDDIVLINPVIVEKSKPFIYSGEGCLSLPPNPQPRTFNTQRFQEITVTMDSFDTATKKLFLSENQKKVIKKYETDIKKTQGQVYTFRGLEAVVLEHEINHMDGILCSDKEYVAKNKVRRNDPCPCGSNIKSKKCCFR